MVSMTAWMNVTSPKQPRRDVTGLLGTGLGVLHSIDAEVLANKINSVTSNLYRLKSAITIFSISIRD